MDDRWLAQVINEVGGSSSLNSLAQLTSFVRQHQAKLQGAVKTVTARGKEDEEGTGTTSTALEFMLEFLGIEAEGTMEVKETDTSPWDQASKRLASSASPVTGRYSSSVPPLSQCYFPVVVHKRRKYWRRLLLQLTIAFVSRLCRE